MGDPDDGGEIGVVNQLREFEELLILLPFA